MNNRLETGRRSVKETVSSIRAAAGVLIEGVAAYLPRRITVETARSQEGKREKERERREYLHGLVMPHMNELSRIFSLSEMEVLMGHDLLPYGDANGNILRDKSGKPVTSYGEMLKRRISEKRWEEFLHRQKRAKSSTASEAENNLSST